MPSPVATATTAQRPAADPAPSVGGGFPLPPGAAHDRPPAGVHRPDAAPRRAPHPRAAAGRRPGAVDHGGETGVALRHLLAHVGDVEPRYLAGVVEEPDRQ